MLLVRVMLASCLVASCAENSEQGGPLPSAVPSGAPASVAPPVPTAQAPSIADVLAAIPEDPPPPHIIRSTHYFVSNEHQLEEFREQANGLGGIFVGVGAEQNYLLAGWARPEVLLMVDFDQWVVDIHFIHGELLKKATTPTEYIASWSAEERESTTKLLTAALPDAAHRERIFDLYRIAQAGVYARLVYLEADHRSAGVASLLTNRSQFDHVANLVRKGHARALRGDFTGDRTLLGIARAARQLEMPVRALYVSNIEDYFDYSGGLGRNLLAQPSDERSLLLRTIPVNAHTYVYVAQPVDEFRGWLARGITSRTQLLASAPMTRSLQGYVLPGPPPLGKSK
jgi:hypothetical protein